MSVTMTSFSFNFCVHSCDLFIAIAGAERGRPSTGAFSYRVGGKFQATKAVARPLGLTSLEMSHGAEAKARFPRLILARLRFSL